MNEQSPSKKLLLEFAQRHDLYGGPWAINEVREDGTRSTLLILDGEPVLASAHEPPQASKDKLPLLEWVLERFENCVRIAKTKEVPADRDGWFEDAAYFREILVILNAQSSHEPPAGLQSISLRPDLPCAELVYRFDSLEHAQAARAAQPPASEPASVPMAPIAAIRVGEDDTCEVLHLYAPGLPPGEHDLYPAASELEVDEPPVFCGGKRPKVPSGVDLIEWCVRQIQITCDAMNLDPVQWLNDSTAQGESSPPPVLARPLEEWHEDMGDAVWWKFPMDEPAYIGSPLASDWPGYHTHWTPHPAVPEAIRYSTSTKSGEQS